MAAEDLHPCEARIRAARGSGQRAVLGSIQLSSSESAPLPKDVRRKAVAVSVGSQNRTKSTCGERPPPYRFEPSNRPALARS